MAKNSSRVITQFKTTIPIEIREKAQIKEGTFLFWEYNNDGSLTVRPVLPVGINKSN